MGAAWDLESPSHSVSNRLFARIRYISFDTGKITFLIRQYASTSLPELGCSILPTLYLVVTELLCGRLRRADIWGDWSMIRKATFAQRLPLPSGEPLGASRTSLIMLTTGKSSLQGWPSRLG